jgi:hypothetical protein
VIIRWVSWSENLVPKELLPEAGKRSCPKNEALPEEGKEERRRFFRRKKKVNCQRQEREFAQSPSRKEDTSEGRKRRKTKILPKEVIGNKPDKYQDITPIPNQTTNTGQ